MRPRPGQLGTVVLAVFLALALAGVLAPAFGWRLDVVQSGSMSPAIGVGDLVVMSPCDAGDVQVGDVICFRSGSTLVCHRVIDVNEAGQTLITKGDANEDPDPVPVPFTSVVGKTAANVPFLGYIVSFLRGPFGWALMILMAILVLVVGSKEKGSPDGKVEQEEGRE